MKYNVGDKVRVKSFEQMAKEYGVDRHRNSITFPGSSCLFDRDGMEKYCGKVFTVESLFNGDTRYRLKDAGGWAWIDEMLEPADVEKIVITQDDREVTAKLYCDEKLVKAESAKCHPNDKFDFKVGAEMAFNRLMEDRVPVTWRHNNGIALGEGAYGTFKLRELRVGDRVRVTMKKGDIDWVSAFDQCRVGEVIGIKDKAEGRRVGVRFDKEHPRLHSCSNIYGVGETIPKENFQRCWNVWEKDLEQIWASPSKAMAEYGKYAAKCFREGVKAGEEKKPERLKVGTRVRSKHDGSAYGFLNGKVGKIIHDDGGRHIPYAVEFEDVMNRIKLHSAHGYGKEFQCLWCDADQLEVVDDFLEGDRVKIVKGYGLFDSLVGKMGTVVCKIAGEDYYGIEIDDYSGGHECEPLDWGRRAKKNTGKWYPSEYLMLVTKDDLKPEKKGEEIKGFSGKAVFTGKGLFGKMGCSFTVGKVYEFKDGYTTDDSGNKRPFGRKPVIDFDKSSFICGDFEKYVEPKYYSGKVVCVKHPRKVGFTVGKVYEVVEGKIIDDDCDRRPCTPDHIKNLDDYCPGCFIPYVEAAAGKEPKYYSGKVVCVKKSNGFTPGKIYEFKDGKVIDDDGDVRPIPSLFGLPEMRIESLDDAFCEGRFIPYVE